MSSRQDANRSPEVFEYAGNCRYALSSYEVEATQHRAVHSHLGGPTPSVAVFAGSCFLYCEIHIGAPLFLVCQSFTPAFQPIFSWTSYLIRSLYLFLLLLPTSFHIRPLHLHQGNSSASQPTNYSHTQYALPIHRYRSLPPSRRSFCPAIATQGRDHSAREESRRRRTFTTTCPAMTLANLPRYTCAPRRTGAATANTSPTQSTPASSSAMSGPVKSALSVLTLAPRA